MRFAQTVQAKIIVTACAVQSTLFEDHSSFATFEKASPIVNVFIIFLILFDVFDSFEEKLWQFLCFLRCRNKNLLAVLIRALELKVVLCSEVKISHHTLLAKVIFVFAIEEICSFFDRLKDCAYATIDIIGISIPIDGLREVKSCIIKWGKRQVILKKLLSSSHGLL